MVSKYFQMLWKVGELIPCLKLNVIDIIENWVRGTGILLPNYPRHSKHITHSYVIFAGHQLFSYLAD